MKPDEYKPISDYALLSDSNSAALVDREGTIAWLCMPRFDSPALFARLLDPEAGHWSMHPTDAFEVDRAYVPGTLVLDTVFRTATGTAKLTDALTFAEDRRGHELGHRAPHELVRLVECLSGSVEMEMEFRPRPEYGLVSPLCRKTDYGARTFGGPNMVALSAGVPVEVVDSRVHARFEVTAGRKAAFAMRWAPPHAAEPMPVPPTRVPVRIHDAVEGWRYWEAKNDVYKGPHREMVRTSARVLRGLTYAPTGAIVAAATTSLPEDIGGERNWDYRFSWIRDASLTLEALYAGACPDEASDFISFMTSSAGGRSDDAGWLQIMYGIGGEHDLAERELDHLRGWRDSRPVRVGNGAWNQTQLDVYGELLNAIYLYREHLDELHPEIKRFAAELANAAARRWVEPDSGMWEMRGDLQHHLSSKVLCWVALDRAVKLAPMLGEFADETGWATVRDEIRAAVVDRGWSESRGAYAQAFDSDELDAAALLMPLLGFLPADDERMRSTIEAIARELTEDGLVLRYRADEGLNADGLRGEEGSFVICSFWLVSGLAKAGEIDRAEELFDRLAGFANDVGLLAEEVDTSTGELLGNYPQAFSHIGLINAARDIDVARGVATQAELSPAEDPSVS